MATASLNDFLHRLGRGMAVEMLGDQSDRQLVQRALAQPDGVALQAVVHRHGAMVYRVCWRVLQHAQDTEDAFQATFLVLAEKLRTVRKHASLASWLHGVAYRVAVRAKLQAATRRRRESQPLLPDRMPPEDVTWKELRSALDAELNQLPDKWRLPLVLCYLEGRTQDEAASHLGWSKSTLRRRLEEARDALAHRLGGRGIMASAALSAVLLSDCVTAAAPMLVAATVGASLKVAAGQGVAAVSTLPIAALTEGVLKAMYMTKLKTAALVLVAAVLLATGIGALSLPALQAMPTDQSEATALVGSNGVPKQPGLAGPQPLRTFVSFAHGQVKDSKDLITKQTQKAIDAGLAYLANEQAEDGSWGTGDLQGSVAVTSLAGLAFISGQPRPLPPPPVGRPDGVAYRKVVTKAVRYVLSRERRDTPGFFHDPKTFHGPMYGQGFAVLFLADAHWTITDKKLQTEVKVALTRAVKLIIDSQNDQGGWRYQPKPQDADVSVTACQVAALRAARDAGIEVPKATIEKAIGYVKSCQHSDNGGFRYQPLGGPSGFARTAAGLTSLNRLGVKDGEAVDNGMNYLRQADLKHAEVQIHYFYGHYYAAKAMWYAGDKQWQKWYPGIRDELLRSRQRDGSWFNGQIGPHYCTSMALIILQMPHATLPSLKR